MLLPEDAIEGSHLGALVADLGCLEPFGLSKAAVIESKQYDFVSAKVGPESKHAGTSIGPNQLLSDILSMGVKGIVVTVRRREVLATFPTPPQRRSFMDVLVRSPTLTFPDWEGGSGNKAYGDLYMALKAKQVLSGFKGFTNAKHGMQFMKNLVQVLYGISSGARGSKSARASRPGPDEERNSSEKPTRRVGPPRAASTNHTAIVFRAGGSS